MDETKVIPATYNYTQLHINYCSYINYFINFIRCKLYENSIKSHPTRKSFISDIHDSLLGTWSMLIERTQKWHKSKVNFPKKQNTQQKGKQRRTKFELFRIEMRVLHGRRGTLRGRRSQWILGFCAKWGFMAWLTKQKEIKIRSRAIRRKIL